MAVISCCSASRLLHEAMKLLLRKLYIKPVQLRGSSSMELACSALLRAGVPGSWKPDCFRTRTKVPIFRPNRENFRLEFRSGNPAASGTTSGRAVLPGAWVQRYYRPLSGTTAPSRFLA